MYILFVNGEKVDQFLPIPDYWEEAISDEEVASWKGNAAILAAHIPGLDPSMIQHYLVRWDLEAEEAIRAYAEDEYEQEDWQLMDFLKKLRIPFPMNDSMQPTGTIYRLWTSDIPLEAVPGKQVAEVTVAQKPWWKFW